MRYGMVIDLKRCIGCHGCQLACKVENTTPPGVFWARVLKREFGQFPKVKRLSLPLLCMHCQNPPCVEACPSGATSQRPDGIVTIDKDKCVGCRYCMMVCPYGARYFHARKREYFPGKGFTPFEEAGNPQHPTGVVEKCDFCLHRVEKGLEPACVANCMAKARYFGDLDDAQSEVSRLIRERGATLLKPEQDTEPSVYYLNIDGLWDFGETPT